MIKDQPIITRDGVKVKVGGLFYNIESKSVTRSSYRSRGDGCITKYSGLSRHDFERGEIIHVNTASNARCFTVRSSNGCETTYSVRNQCLPKTTFGSLFGVKKEIKRLNSVDVSNIEQRVKLAKEEYEKRKACLSKLKKAVK